MSNRRKLPKPRFPRQPRLLAEAAAIAGETNAWWNGLPTTAVRGTAVVADAPQFPQYWAKTEGLIGQRIDVVQVDLNGVNHGGGISYLDDREGQGWHKVTVGHGSPRYGSRDVAIEPGSFRPSSRAE